MLRAEELIDLMDDAALATVAKRLRASEAEPDAVAVAMRSTELLDRVLPRMKTALSREDLFLLCANPYDIVAPDEIGDPVQFEEIGLIYGVNEEGYSVNIDMALTMVGETPFEFGFAATLLARLAPVDLTTIAKAVEVGPRPNHVDYILDIVEASVGKSSAMNHLARLRADDRKELVSAIELGELPDELELPGAGSELPRVTIDGSSAAGKLGLVYWYEDPARDIEARLVVPLERQEDMAQLLQEVPAAPEVSAQRPRRTRRTNTGTSRKKRQSSATSLPSVTDEFRAPPTTDRVAQGGPPRVTTVSQAVEAVAPPRVSGPREIQAANASGVVDLESPRWVEAAKKDAELSASILEVVAETLVVLKSGTDVEEWVERYALRVGVAN